MRGNYQEHEGVRCKKILLIVTMAEALLGDASEADLLQAAAFLMLIRCRGEIAKERSRWIGRKRKTVEWNGK